jgi:hypothetical protein
MFRIDADGIEGWREDHRAEHSSRIDEDELKTMKLVPYRRILNKSVYRTL